MLALQEFKSSDFFSISLTDLNKSRWCLRILKTRVPRNSFCDGRGAQIVLFRKSCDSSGISAQVVLSEKSKTTRLNCPTVLIIELIIVPDKSHGDARASMQSFRLAGRAQT